MEFQHVSVLLEETIEGLNIRPNGIYVDGTAGGAGHSSQIAKRLSFEQGGRLIAIDKDPDAIQTATQRLAPYPAAQVVDGDFKDIPQILQRLGIPFLPASWTPPSAAFPITLTPSWICA